MIRKIIAKSLSQSQQLILDILKNIRAEDSINSFEKTHIRLQNGIIRQVYECIVNDEFLESFFHNLALKPYCTDVLGAPLLIRPKSTAITKVYIQPNPVHCIYWLVLDLDYDVQKYWYDENPVPNITIENPVNGHQHIMYLLETPVYKLQNARLQPLEYAADVERGLSLRFNADLSYGKLISKNPLHPQWKMIVWHTNPYTLGDLLVNMPQELKRHSKLKPEEEIGLGRNCTLFHTIRRYAYNQAHKVKYDYNALYDKVLEYATGFNNGFNPPLLSKEVQCTTRSVCRWTVKRMDSTGFSRWCSVRGKKGNQKSQIVHMARSQSRSDEAKALYATGKTQQQIALILNISKRQVIRLLSKQ
jgi:hypothetical protein